MRPLAENHRYSRLSLLPYARQSLCLMACTFSILILTSQVKLKEMPEGQYFGQEYPGSIPEAFGRGILPDDLHSIPVFSADGSEVFFKPMNNEEILVMRMIDGRWSVPGPLFVREEINNSDDPCLTPDGSSLYFSAYNKNENREYIYFCRQHNDFVCKPELPPGEINSIDLHWQISIAENGNFYCSSNGNIYCSVLGENGSYGQPVKLDTTINTQKSECTPFVSPDESTLIFSRGNGTNSDLYISHKNEKGDWQTARPLPEGINTEYHEMCPGISPDGRFLFFLSSREGLFSTYWVAVGEWFK